MEKSQLDENKRRIERIKKILGIEQDQELAAACDTQHPRVSYWKNKGFHKSTAKLWDLVLDAYDKDCTKKK